MSRRRSIALIVLGLLIAVLIGGSAASAGPGDVLNHIHDMLHANGFVDPPTTTTTSTTSTTTTVATTTTTAATTTTVATTTTTAPSSGCTGLTVAAGSSLGTVMSGQPAGTTFCLGAGTFSIAAALPFQSGDQVIGALGPAGERLSLLTGGGTTSYLVTATSSNVVLANVIVERFNNATQQGVNTGAQTFWTVDNVELRENAGTGWHLHDDSRIINSWVHHNRQMGLGGSGDRALVENVLIEWNNYLGQYDWGWEAGGTKFVNAVGLVVRSSTSRNNCGPGFWTDGTGNVGIVYQNNVATDNHGPGIMHEIGGAALIEGNTASGNAWGNLRSATSCVSPGTTGGFGGGILIKDSRDVEARSNVVSDNDGGLVVVNDTGVGLGLHPINLWIHDNDITNASGGYHAAGCKDNESGNVCYAASSNNRWDFNDYHTADAVPFEWNDSRIGWSAWQGLGFDLAGSCC